MPCDSIIIDTPVGPFEGIVCSRGRKRSKTCFICRTNEATRLCDAPVEPSLSKSKSRTCNTPLCYRCSIHREPDADVCPDHAEWADSLVSHGELAL